MNTIIVTKQPLPDEIKDVLIKNNCSPIHMIKNTALVETKLSGLKNLVIIDWHNEVQEEITALRSIMKLHARLQIRILILADLSVKDVITALVNHNNVRTIFRPISKERLQIGLRMLLYEKKEPIPPVHGVEKIEA